MKKKLTLYLLITIIGVYTVYLFQTTSMLHKEGNYLYISSISGLCLKETTLQFEEI